ncbi:glycosyltransferase family 2 protein [Pseudomonas simiae]|uniref:glycosyltransferase family 2 protein n=1 Tax=Pseudomonas simiae TaxID=321846 RepID=UPI0020951EAA|nr:glycosyltransferase family 2 protein [Pseudomonas simiae]
MLGRRVSIVAPFYNEADNVMLFYNAVKEVIDSIKSVTFELICVDDGSRDDTLVRLIELSNQDARVHVIELSRNFGKEAALTAGISEATGDAVIPIDADLQDPPELIETMIKEWQSGFEVVLARRIDRNSDTFLKRKTAEMFYSLHNKLSNVKIPENVGDFRLMDRVVVDAVLQLSEQQRFMKGLFAWVGYKTTTINYVRNSRAAGDTKFSGWKLWNFALEGITSFTSVPLKLWTYIGGAGALGSLLYTIFIVVRTMVHGVDIPGYASLLVAILFMGSLQLISVGVLGEYVGRVYAETKHRPIYFIRKKYKKII